LSPDTDFKVDQDAAKSYYFEKTLLLLRSTHLYQVDQIRCVYCLPFCALGVTAYLFNIYTPSCLLNPSGAKMEC